MSVKVTVGGALTGVRAVKVETLEVPKFGDYGLMPGGGLSVRVVVDVASVESIRGIVFEGAFGEGHSFYACEAGVHSVEKSVLSLYAIEACGVGSTSGVESEEGSFDVYESAVKVSEKGVTTNVIGFMMSCPSLFSARMKVDADVSRETSLEASVQGSVYTIVSGFVGARLWGCLCRGRRPGRSWLRRS